MLGMRAWLRCRARPAATLPRRRRSPTASSSVQVTDSVLEPALLAQVAAELASAADAGQFTTSHEQPEHIRTDQILWLNTELAEQRGMPATAAAIEAFRDHIMASLGGRPGAQAARYLWWQGRSPVGCSRSAGDGR